LFNWLPCGATTNPKWNGGEKSVPSKKKSAGKSAKKSAKKPAAKKK
jgi:hypothetical protein